MTTGRITAEGEAALYLTAQRPDASGEEQERVRFEAIIDTGFNGALTLPSEQIEAMGLPRVGAVSASERVLLGCTDQVQLGDGSLVDVRLFEAVIMFEGRPYSLLIEEAPTVPLIGTKLLWGCGLRVDFEVGGRVEVEALS